MPSLSSVTTLRSAVSCIALLYTLIPVAASVFLPIASLAVKPYTHLVERSPLQVDDA